MDCFPTIINFKMELVSNSLCGEDIILTDLLRAEGFDLSHGGTYVDVGAHHPRLYSNTNLFYQHGWSGLNFEPNEKAQSLFEKERPRDMNFGIALSDKKCRRTFHTYSDSALNSLVNRDDELASSPYDSCGKIAVNVSTLALELTKHFKSPIPTPNFLDIDVEGSELEVLKGNDWSNFRFNFILLELKLKTVEQLFLIQVTKYLADINYIPVACTRLTTIFKDKLM